MKNYLIIGNGVAAVGAIEGIRSKDKNGKITVVSKENHPVYCRPLISYYLEGKTSIDKIGYRPNDFYEKNGCEVIYGKSVTSIDSKGKKVILDDNTELVFDKVCITTGSSPFVPQFKGVETVKNSFGFMTLDDALMLEKAISPDSRVLIIGAGLIGLKCAEGICEKVASVTVCDLSDRVLSSILDKKCAAHMQSSLEKHGVRFMLNDTATEFQENKAIMKSGATIDFDVLVLAVGVIPNTSVALSCGAKCNKGILADSYMQTTVSDVFTAGDCAEGYDASINANRVLAILPNAYIGGHTAGTNMAGGKAEFNKAIPMNSIGFFGFHAMSAGSYDGTLYEEKGKDFLKRLYVKDDCLCGFMIVGNYVERVGILTSLIREKTSLSSINFEMLLKETTNAVFNVNERRKKFGGAV